MKKQDLEADIGLVLTGRPTRDYARKRQEQLLEKSFEMFARDGFELTSMDAIAASINMTKRTIYARYKDKGELFEASVKRVIERLYIPTDVLRAADTGELETTLIAIARMRIKNNLSRDGLHLQRTVATEAFRFPKIFSAYEAATVNVIKLLVEIFENYSRKEKVQWSSAPELAASSFLALVNSPVRTALLFNRMPKPDEIEAHIRDAVRLLLNGMRPR